MFNMEKLRQELIRDEGLRTEAYQDTVGLWTIGVGHLLGKGRRMLRITNNEAMALLAADIIDAVLEVDRSVHFWLRLDEVRQRALVNMSFNLGPKLSEFIQFKSHLVKENWVSASAAMLNSKWATQVGERAKRLSLMIETGKDA